MDAVSAHSLDQPSIAERLRQLILSRSGAATGRDGLATGAVASIAVVLPVAYRGGTLRAFRSIVKMLCHGSRDAGESVKVVAAVPAAGYDLRTEFRDLREAGASVRPYEWRTLDRHTVQRALAFVDDAADLPAEYANALVADDGINHLLDCDFWLVVSDRLSAPLAPLRPTGLVVFDYLQRVQPAVLTSGYDDAPFLFNARQSRFVLCTTPFTAHAAEHYAGVEARRVHVTDMDIEVDLEERVRGGRPPRTPRPYFLWPTNLAAHKNHLPALDAIEGYLALGGALDVVCCGVETRALDPSVPSPRAAEPLLADIRERVAGSQLLRSRLHFVGELGTRDYLAALARARFVFHPATADNGTYAVTEAAWLGVPSLSNDYPAMRWMDERLRLALAFCDIRDAEAAAEALADMEREAHARKARLPTREALRRHGWRAHARAFWSTVARLIEQV